MPSTRHPTTEPTRRLRREGRGSRRYRRGCGQASVLTAGKAHDLVRRHARVCRAPISPYPLARLQITCRGLSDHHGTCIFNELDLRMWQQAEAFADILRYRDLALAGDAHRSLLMARSYRHEYYLSACAATPRTP